MEVISNIYFVWLVRKYSARPTLIFIFDFFSSAQCDDVQAQIHSLARRFPLGMQWRMRRTRVLLTPFACTSSMHQCNTKRTKAKRPPLVSHSPSSCGQVVPAGKPSLRYVT